MPNESWANSRYGPLNMSWQQAQQVWLPSVNKRLGPAFFHLEKLWAKYKRLGREGDYRSDVAFQIALYQKALDLPVSELPELEGLPDYEFEN
jgi:hypothetical protein